MNYEIVIHYPENIFSQTYEMLSAKMHDKGISGDCRLIKVGEEEIRNKTPYHPCLIEWKDVMRMERI